MMDLTKKPFYLGETDIKWVEETLKGMSAEEKIKQLFFLIAYSADDEYLKGLASESIGGFMCRPMPAEETIKTNAYMQQNSKIPLLIAANLEAGGNGAVVGGTKIGRQMQVGATADVEMAEKLAITCAEQGLAAGVNYNFAPITDLDYNFRNPITNTRTFGSNEQIVKDFSVRFVEASQKLGMATSPKHFPGDGVDERDQHLVTSINSLSCEDWDKTYGEVYKACIDAGALTIMIGHIMQPAYSKKLNPNLKDEDIMPATLAPELLNGLLREKLGFNGMIITDATTMAGMTIPMSRRKAVPYTIASGCDMFLFTKNLQEDIDFMLDGYKEGIITDERLDEAVTRILATKASIKLHEKQASGEIVPTLENLQKVISDDKYLTWRDECADKAITLVKEQKGLLPISVEKTPRVLLYGITPSGESFFGRNADATEVVPYVKARLEKEGFKVDVWEAPKGMEGRMQRISDVTDNYDLIIYFASLSTKSNQTTVRIEWAQPMGVNVPQLIQDIPTIFVSTENPYHLLDVPRVKTFINTYNSEPWALDALVDKLMGKSEFKGVSPVDAFCGMWDTRL